jgi:UDP-N-acetylglucosamine/UDP-N-acetylgalactosamine diphosphorylase
MPAVDDRSGKLLLAERHHLALSPDGHGGMLRTISRSGLLDHLDSRGIRYLFYLQVDNPLVDICNPEFLGYHVLSKSDLTSEVVCKKTPKDRLGNVVEVDGKLYVIEYSDLPDEIAEQRGPDGKLVIWAGSIAVHVFNTEFLFRMAQQSESLPFHIANKKVTYVDADGRTVLPQTSNAIKFERFIFDLMPWAANSFVVEVDRAKHFAPVKNAPGSKEGDTPELAQTQIVDLHTEWLEQAGITAASGVPVEICPLLALDADELSRKIGRKGNITKPMYLTKPEDLDD